MLSKQQKTMYLIGIILVVILLAFLTWQTLSQNTQQGSTNEESTSQVLPSDPGPSDDRDMVIDDPIENELIKALMGEDFDYEGDLEDVTGGEDVRGINTKGVATGVAKAKYRSDTKYQLLAEFDELPDPKEDDFYEGWVVRTEPFAFISTGKLEKVGGVYMNGFESDTDYTDYARYVLTLEPNDNDPAPADHIVEGNMAEIPAVK